MYGIQLREMEALAPGQGYSATGHDKANCWTECPSPVTALTGIVRACPLVFPLPVGWLTLCVNVIQASGEAAIRPTALTHGARPQSLLSGTGCVALSLSSWRHPGSFHALPINRSQECPSAE